MSSWINFLMLYMWTVKSIQEKTDKKGRPFVSVSLKPQLQNKKLWVKSVVLYTGDDYSRMLINYGGLNSRGKIYSSSGKALLKSYDSGDGSVFDIEIRNGKMVAIHPHRSAEELIRGWKHHFEGQTYDPFEVF